MGFILGSTDAKIHAPSTAVVERACTLGPLDNADTETEAEVVPGPVASVADFVSSASALFAPFANQELWLRSW